MKIKLVIFDLDGTLVDAYPAIIRSLNHTLHKLGYPPEPPLRIRRSVGRGDRKLLALFVRRKDLDMALEIYRKDHQFALLKGARLLPGVKGLLSRLKQKGVVLAVASNRPTRFSRIIIRHLGLKKYFDYVLCADKLKQGKPHPEILKKIISRFSLKPQETLYVGDMSIDAQTGRRARVRTVIVTTGSSSLWQIRREKPYRVLKDVAGLARFF